MSLLILSMGQIKSIFQNWGFYVSSRDRNQLNEKGKLSFSGLEGNQKAQTSFYLGGRNKKEY